MEQVLGKQMDKHLILNVNFPAVPDNLIKGIKVCRQAYAKVIFIRCFVQAEPDIAVNTHHALFGVERFIYLRIDLVHGRNKLRCKTDHVFAGPIMIRFV